MSKHYIQQAESCLCNQEGVVVGWQTRLSCNTTRSWMTRMSDKLIDKSLTSANDITRHETPRTDMINGVCIPHYAYWAQPPQLIVYPSALQLSTFFVSFKFTAMRDRIRVTTAVKSLMLCATDPAMTNTHFSNNNCLWTPHRK